MTIVDHGAPGSVYVLRNTVTGREYVGSSLRLRERRLSHFRNLQRGRHPSRRMQEDYADFGQASFVWTTLIHSYCKKRLVKMESQLIAYLFSRVELYNIMVNNRELIIGTDYEDFAGHLFAYCSARFNPAFYIQMYTPRGKPINHKIKNFAAPTGFLNGE